VVVPAQVVAEPRAAATVVSPVKAEDWAEAIGVDAQVLDMVEPKAAATVVP
jgi:hypothetical protein